MQTFSLGHKKKPLRKFNSTTSVPEPLLFDAFEEDQLYFGGKRLPEGYAVCSEIAHIVLWFSEGANEVIQRYHGNNCGLTTVTAL